MSKINNEQQEKAKKLRDSLAKDFDKDKAKEFANTHKEMKWYEDFIILYDMVTSSTYEISTKTKLTIAGTLAYVVLPIDVIPDFVPMIGWLDDAFILALTKTTLSQELELYKKHKII